VSGSLALLAVSLLPTLVGMAGQVYFAGALALGLGLTWLGALQARHPSAVAARRVLLASLLYLPALMALLVLGR
jgi:protoheme IX farnesyltransferase